MRLYQNYITGDDGDYDIYGVNWAGQTFTPVLAHMISKLKLKLFRVGDPGTVNISIKLASSGKPVGGDLCAGTIEGTDITLSTNGEWYEITLGDGYTFTKNVQYAIVIKAVSGDASNKVSWRADVSSPTYAGGTYCSSSDSGIDWGTVSGGDCMFEEWGVGEPSPGTTVWGNLVKSAVSSEKIEEAISRMIQDHENDENAHVEIGESLYSHKASEIIDHIAQSIIADKVGLGEIWERHRHAISAWKRQLEMSPDRANNINKSKWTGATGEDFLYEITFDGTYFYAAMGNVSVKVVKINGETMETVAVTGALGLGGAPSGIVFDGTYLYVTGLSGTGKVVKIDPSDMSVVDSWTAAAGNTGGNGLTFDGEHVYAGILGALVGPSKVVNSEDDYPFDVFLKPDGTKMYIVGYINSTIYQYALSTAWDISTASYETKFKDVSAQEGTPKSVFFKPDGTKMYVIGATNKTIYQYALSTAWDVSTASYETKLKDVSSEDGSPGGMFFKPDGYKVYVMGATNDKVFQYALSTAWDISTASYETKFKDVSSEDNIPQEVFFKPDGTKMYIIGSQTGKVYQYALSSAWDVSTASYETKFKDVTSDEIYVAGIFFKPDGNVMYVVGYDTGRVWQYPLLTQWDVSTAKDIIYNSYSMAVVKIDPSDMSVVATYMGRMGNFNIGDLIYDGQYIYASSRTAGGRVIKIDPSDMTEAGIWGGDAGEDYCYPLTFDGTYVYVGLNIDPGKVIKINPSTMVTVASYTGAAGINYFYGITFDGQYIYAAAMISPGKIIKIDPSDMSKISIWTGETGENNFNCLASDGIHIFFGGNTSPAIVIRKIMRDIDESET